MASLLGADYASSDDDGTSSKGNAEQMTAATPVVAAPDVSLDVWSHQSLNTFALANIL